VGGGGGGWGQTKKKEGGGERVPFFLKNKKKSGECGSLTGEHTTFDSALKGGPRDVVFFYEVQESVFYLEGVQTGGPGMGWQAKEEDI